MKRLVIGLLAIVAAVYAVVSPYSVPKTLERYSDFQDAVFNYEQATADYNSQVSSLQSAQSNFDSTRTFEVHYSDIDRITQVLKGVATVNVTDLTSCDPANMFNPVSTYIQGDTPAALRISVATEDPVGALRILDKMQLPMYDIHVVEPNLIEFTFLTGGAF